MAAAPGRGGAVYRSGGRRSGTTLFSLGLGYTTQASGCDASGTDNNGNLTSEAITAPGLSGTASQTYTYDSLNRLKTMTEAGGCAQRYAYDRYGNRAVVTGTGYCVPTTVYTPNLASDDPAQVESIFPNNRWTGASYDTAGNENALAGWQFQYDGEGRMTRALSSIPEAPIDAAYVYDGEGRRVQRTVNGTTTTYVYDAMGNLAAEYGGEAATGGRVYLTADHLGSTRLITNASGTAVECRDYFPFGEEISPDISASRTGCYGGDVAKQKFTGKERDAETGLDYFGARYFSGAQGRFTSPDEPFIDQDPSNPQSWNLYGYGRNNPLRYSDPTGRKCVQTDGGSWADDGTGGGCDKAGVDANGNIQSQQVDVAAYNVRNTGYGVEVYDNSNGQLVYESGLQHDYAADLGLLGIVRGVGGAIFGGVGAGATAQSAVWSLGPTTRGGVIETMLGANLPRTFPVIDRFANGIATSIKSIDLRAASYANPANLERVLANHVDKLAGFSGGKLGTTVIEGSQIGSRVLEVAVPQGAASGAQQAVLNRVAARAAQQGVKVVFIPIR